MSEVMRRCVAVSTGALSPDCRVNYQFGLVLGVDEFEQEDLYLRERDERAARSLHGYGTTVGMHVTADRPVVAPDDVEVRVEPGSAVDQYGRPIVIRTAQCARVGAWLAGEERDAAAAGQPSPLEANLRPSGDLTLYVVAEYASCPDALVPLPGNPCDSDDDVTAASRVRDSWRLGFRWEPPSMPHWDGVRELADLLTPIELHDGSLLESDEELLAAHVRALAPGATTPALPLPTAPVLPRSGARAALDRLLTIWITEVRPLLAPDLVQPSGEAAILLSTITVVPAWPFVTAAPVITACSLPDDEGRPYLAPTQLIQELVLLGAGVATIVAGSPIETPAPAPSVPQIELASLTEVPAGMGRQLVLWSHLPTTLVLPPTVAVTRNGGAPMTFTVSANPVPDTFRLVPPAGGFVDGELLEVGLDLAALRVREPGSAVEIPLQLWLQRAGLDVAGQVGEQLRLWHTMARTPPAPPPPPPIQRVRQLATGLSVSVRADDLPRIELWWHVDKEQSTDEERVTVDWRAVQVLAEVRSGATPVAIDFEATSPQHNVFHLRLNAEHWRRSGQLSPYLRVLVPLDLVQLSNFGGTAREYADDLGIVWEDAQEDGALLALWIRMDVGLR